MLQRPDKFTLNYGHQLAKGLVFAGLGAHAGGTHYHDSSVYANSGNGNSVYAHELGRSCIFASGNDNGFEIPRTPQLEPSTITVSVWVQFNSWASTQPARYKPIVAKDYTGFANPYYSYHLRGDSYGQSIFWVVVPTNYANNSFVNPAFGGNVGGWTHLCATHDNSASTTTRLYIDGVLAASNNQQVTIAYHNTPLTIGKSNVLNDASDHKIADVLIYNRTLLPSEIASLADPSNVMLSGLIQEPARKWWPVVSAAPVGFAGSSNVVGGGIFV